MCVLKGCFVIRRVKLQRSVRTRVGVYSVPYCAHSTESHTYFYPLRSTGSGMQGCRRRLRPACRSGWKTTSVQACSLIGHRQCEVLGGAVPRGCVSASLAQTKVRTSPLFYYSGGSQGDKLWLVGVRLWRTSQCSRERSRPTVVAGWLKFFFPSCPPAFFVLA